ncbi:hypothetical protein FALBO_16635 [Fusarium albosuccineum]|uniref:Uncharacterized protein n=1 Tax=Fusarium albosuccineum TaxID=1237068 RepID=A0A8H4KH03_9HYPO|nr:hypothetical protein FALBO_16635 [Fusarium albosuccineum]
MKVLNLFVYCTVVANAIIPPSQLALNTIAQATQSDNPSAVDDSLHLPWPHALVAREPSQRQELVYKSAKQAAGSASLKAGKHYYFMNCYVSKKGYKPPGPPEEWVLQESQKPKKGFAGCFYVGLVFGTEMLGCTFGCGKSVGTFEVTYKHVILFSPDNQRQYWHLKDYEYQPSLAKSSSMEVESTCQNGTPI